MSALVVYLSKFNKKILKIDVLLESIDIKALMNEVHNKTLFKVKQIMKNQI